MVRWLAAFLILAGSVSAQITIDGHTFADTIQIWQSMLPYTATTNDRAYVLMEDMSGKMQSTGAIYFNNCDTCALISNGTNKYTITLDTNGIGNQYGVRASSSDFVKIRRVRVVAAWDRTDTLQGWTVMVRINGGLNSDMDSSYVYATGYIDADDWSDGLNAVCIDDGSSTHTYMNDFEHDSIITDGTGFPDRHVYPSIGIIAKCEYSDGNLTEGSDQDYNVRIAHSYIQSNWCGAFFYGRGTRHGVYVLDSCELNPTGQNTSSQNFSGSYHGDGGGFGMVWVQKVFIRGNVGRPTVNLGATPPQYGGAGCFVSSIEPTTLPATPRSEIAYNDLYGRLDRSTDHGTAFFAKYTVRGVDIHDNIFRSYCNSNGIGWAAGAWISHMSGTNFYNNTMIAVAESDAIDAYGIIIRGLDTNTVLVPNQIYGNTIQSNDWMIEWYPDQDYTAVDGIQNGSFGSWTFERVDTATTMSGDGSYFFYRAYEMTNCSLLNVSCNDGVKDTAWVWAGSGAGVQEMDWFRDLQINTDDGAGSPVAATVVLDNAYGDEIFNANVGADGLDTARVKYYRLSGNGTTDSTAFNPISYTVTFGDSVATGSMNVGAGDSVLTVSMGAGPAEQGQRLRKKIQINKVIPR